MSDLVERLRAGICDDPCRVRDIPSGCACAEAAARIEELEAENASLSTWQCEFTDGKTGLVYGEGGGIYCAMAKRVEALEKEAYHHAITCRAIPDEFALEPPDGGDVKPWEAVSEMANTIERYRAALTIISDHWKHGYGGPTRGDVISAVEKIARAALEDRT